MKHMQTWKKLNEIVVSGGKQSGLKYTNVTQG